MSSAHPRVEEVFVPGAYPALTYNPRKKQSLEQEVAEFLSQKGQCLMVSGPSKAGKTVLIEHSLPPGPAAAWVSGNDIRDIEEFWEAVLDQLDAFTEVQQTYVDQDTAEVGGDLTVGIPDYVGVRLGGKAAAARADQISGSRVRRPSSVVIETLRREPKPIVLDDFHYIPKEARTAITLAVKQLIQLTHVVLIAVPHEAFDPVRRNPDMNGRVWGLKVKDWDEQELAEIARDGFDKLHVEDRDGQVAARLAAVSMGAPALMQQLCLSLLRDGGVEHWSQDWVPAPAPDNWSNLFQTIADRYEPSVFAAIRTGPPTRGKQRVERVHLDGRKTDVYGTILVGMAALSPRRNYSYLDLSDAIAKAFPGPVKNDQLTSALNHLSEIAWKARGKTDPALAYKDDHLTILDPYLAFYLRFGSWTLPVHRSTEEPPELF